MKYQKYDTIFETWSQNNAIASELRTVTFRMRRLKAEREAAKLAK